MPISTSPALKSVAWTVESASMASYVKSISQRRDCRGHWMANLDNFRTAQRLTSCDGIVCAIAVIELLPFFLQVIHSFLLLLSCCRSVETHKVACWVKLEYLGSQFEVNPDEYHG
jgi:hypothetical protein